MNTTTLVIKNDTAEYFDSVEKLAEKAFGPGRFARSAFRLREGVPHEQELSFVACKDGELAGCVRLTKIMVGEDEALLLGPLVVSPEYKNTGIGRKLMQTSVDAARKQGHACIILVGDLSYYERFGFTQVKPGKIQLPGPVDPARLLICNLKDGAAERFSGVARKFQDN